MNILDLPHNVLLKIAKHLDLRSKYHLALVNKQLFGELISIIYRIVVFEPNYDPVTRSDDGYRDDSHITIITNKNIDLFFQAITGHSYLGVNYASFIVQLYLEKLSENFIHLQNWQNNANRPIFEHLERYTFPGSLQLHPLTYENAPNLNTLTIDSNFCEFVDYNRGSIEFFNQEHVKNLYFKGILGKNEDMVLFKLLTKFPHMIHRLQQIHFLVDADEVHEIVYRRIVGFFAILRKMNLIMGNVHRLTLTLTNISSSSIISLISKHVIFENLDELTLLIQDDGKVLTLVKTLDKLTSIIHDNGINIRKLTIRYNLTRTDQDKNHLRSMMLLKLFESFRGLTHLNLDLRIEGLNFSNILMILGTPIGNNLSTLNDVQLNVYHPSENMISNILPTFEDVMILFPQLNFLNKCDCNVCHSILKLFLEDTPASIFTDEKIKVSTLLLIGHELDLAQLSCTHKNTTHSFINEYSSEIAQSQYPKVGFLFDHFISKQLNCSLQGLLNLTRFEICGLIYTKTAGEFKLMYGSDPNCLDLMIIDRISDIRQMFGRGPLH